MSESVQQGSHLKPEYQAPVRLWIMVGRPMDWRRNHVPKHGRPTDAKAGDAVETMCGRSGEWRDRPPRRSLGTCLDCTRIVRDAPAEAERRRVREALMVAHADDWSMETIAEAAYICAQAQTDAVWGGRG